MAKRPGSVSYWLSWWCCEYPERIERWAGSTRSGLSPLGLQLSTQLPCCPPNPSPHITAELLASCPRELARFEPSFLVDASRALSSPSIDTTCPASVFSRAAPYPLLDTGSISVHDEGCLVERDGHSQTAIVLARSTTVFLGRDYGMCQ